MHQLDRGGANQNQRNPSTSSFLSFTNDIFGSCLLFVSTFLLHCTSLIHWQWMTFNCSYATSSTSVGSISNSMPELFVSHTIHQAVCWLQFDTRTRTKIHQFPHGKMSHHLRALYAFIKFINSQEKKNCSELWTQIFGFCFAIACLSV